jgi:hypothetical protein
MGALNPPLRREETLVVALLLAFAGGYLDTYAWITHGILANAQTANLVFLWVHATAAQWQQAFHFVPPLFAFFVGVVIAAWLRRAAGERAGQLSLVIEIAMLILVGIRAQSPSPGCGHAWHLHGRRHADLDLHQGRRRDLQLGDDHRQLPPGDRGGICLDLGDSAGRAPEKILHLDGSLRRLWDRSSRRCLPHRAGADAHAYRSCCGAAARLAALRDIACNLYGAALI